ncbi:MAG: hypothetical protein IPP79_08920 [Chitinophagaceae bacterium]|nr:hypothetical protein [Chitinophagaceae bacterium]
MSREFLMFIAYKTVESFGTTNNNFGQFGKAKNFIAVIAALNIIEILLTINSIFFEQRISLSISLYFILIFSVFVIYFLISLVFKRSVLAKAIKRYKDTNFNDSGKVVGLLYLFINLGIAVGLVIEMERFEY